METLRALADDGVTVVLAIHDLALAARYCDEVAVLEAGRLRGFGAPVDVLTGDLPEQVFGVRTEFASGRLLVDPLDAEPPVVVARPA
jgi:iron complex transport system ATP-binding protein